MSEALTEMDIAAQFAGEPEPELSNEADAWLVENEPATPEAPQFDLQAAIAAGVNQHMTALVEEFEAAQAEQRAAEEYQQQVYDWLAEAAADPVLYEQRLDAIRLEQLRGEVRQELAPLYELAAQVQAQQAAELQNEINHNAAVTATEVFSEEREQLGVAFDFDQAWSVANQITSLAYGDLFTHGHSPQEAEQILREHNFAEAALRAAARMIAGNGQPSATGQPRVLSGVGDELSVARNFIDRSQPAGPPPRSPSEAIRAVEARGGFNPYGRNDLPTSELDVARRFIDARRGAYA